MDRDRRRALRRLAIYALVLGAAFAIAAATGSIPSAGELRDWGDGLGALGVVAAVPLFAVLNLFIAWTILAGAIGLLFGTWVGTPVALLGVTGAALLQMAIARYLAGDQVGALLPTRAARVEAFLERNGLVAVMESRILPLVPYALVSYSAGLTRLRFRDMGLGTLVGGAPKVFAYVALGGSITNLAAPEAKVAVALLLALGVAGALVVRRRVAAERLA
jgi:uncharacterized membrane protein YdjX (TVP38/TMEM64 family)